MSVPTDSLPTGWTTATLGTICDAPQYGWTTSASDADNGVKLLRSTDISHGTVNWETVPFCETAPSSIEKYQLHSGDIVITRTGAGVGNSLLLGECPTSVFASYLIRFRPHSTVSAKYIAYFLRSSSYRSLVSINSAGIAQPNVNASKLASLELPLAPRNEQDAIVAEMEKQFTRLDAAVAALRRTQANLKRYRAAVLKAACEGRLVPTEPELSLRENRHYEHAATLLERILAERRCRWEANQLAKLRASGNELSEKWKARYAVPEEPEIEVLPTLPEGWTWATLSQLSEIQGGIQKQPSRKPIQNSHPFLRVANVLRGRLDLSEIHQIELFKGELEKLRLEVNDLLIVEGNGSPSEIGRMAIWRGEIEGCVHQNHIIRSRLRGGILPAYVAAYWNSPMGTSRVLNVASSTSGLYTLSVSKVGRIPIPLPPLAEQERIIAEIERRLSVNDELDSQLEANVKRAERLRQSVLKSAFEGKLAPQDPNDEPASVLLKRIRNERDAKSGGVMPKERRREVAVP